MNTILLISLFFCHFLADYTHLSMTFMLDAKRLGKPLAPILAHAAIHMILMGIALAFFINVWTDTQKWAQLMMFQLITHFLIDVWKGKMNGWFPALQSPANKWHWVIFGFDQFLHALVIILMVYFV